MLVYISGTLPGYPTFPFDETEKSDVRFSPPQGPMHGGAFRADRF